MKDPRVLFTGTPYRPPRPRPWPEVSTEAEYLLEVAVWNAAEGYMREEDQMAAVALVLAAACLVHLDLRLGAVGWWGAVRQAAAHPWWPWGFAGRLASR